jgi:F-type H+-transporting ATPase subunit a
MENNPLQTAILFHLGPIPIAEAVVTTWGIMAVMTGVSWLVMRHAQVEAGPLQSMLEVVVETIANQVREITGSLHPAFLPLLSTLFLFLVVANLSAILPGVKTPTAHIETPAALAVLVFLSTHFFGIKSRGLTAYLRHYTQPSILLMPLNVLSEVTRTFSLMIRLFGNMMSHELVLTIIVMLAGLLLPIPFLLLGVLIGIIQAYIFTVLAAVYIGAATGAISIE